MGWSDKHRIKECATKVAQGSIHNELIALASKHSSRIVGSNAMFPRRKPKRP